MEGKQFKPESSHYKVVELSTVTNETIEDAVNNHTSQGWLFDQIQFVVRESSRRPSMAFIFFTRPVLIDESPGYEKKQLKPESDQLNQPDSSSNEEEGEIKWS